MNFYCFVVAHSQKIINRNVITINPQKTGKDGAGYSAMSDMAQSAKKNVTPRSGVTRKPCPGHSRAGGNPGVREMALSPIFGLAREWFASSNPCLFARINGDC
jgi:hypothetical protein